MFGRQDEITDWERLAEWAEMPCLSGVELWEQGSAGKPKRGENAEGRPSSEPQVSVAV